MVSPQHGRRGSLYVGATHPLLRSAAGDVELARAFRRVHANIRRSLDGSLSEEERVKAAHSGLAALWELRLPTEEERSLRIQWLGAIAHDLTSIPLLEARAAAEIQGAGCEVAPGNWLDPECLTTSASVPYLAKVGGGARPQLPASAREAWQTAIERIEDAMRTDTLGQWDLEECLSGVRIITLYSTLPAACDVRGAADRLSFFEGVGLALWKALVERIAAFGDLDTKESFWGEQMQYKVLLHLRGLASAGALEERCGPTTSFDRGMPEIAALNEVAGQGVMTVVYGQVPPSSDKQDSETIRQYAPLCRPVKISEMPPVKELDTVLTVLRAEFPWAPAVVDHLQDELRTPSLIGVRDLRMAPVLLVGAPGAGKSRLVRRVAELLHLPYMAVGCGGSSDSKVLAGTTRGWATGEPSPILRLMLQHGSASALLLLDEIDKSATTATNAIPLTSTLLGLLEPETARRWRDSFLQAPCDLSKVIFWATANGLSAIPRPLLSRFVILYMPEPGPEHLPTLVEKLTAEWSGIGAFPLGFCRSRPQH